jgi:hypothetical protein
VLVVQAVERGTARGVAGKIARPWETPYQTIISPPDDKTAIGLLEAMRQPGIGQVIVAGLPGSDYAWSAVERDARDAGIQLTFVGVTNRLQLDRVSIDVVPPTEDTVAFLRIERDAAVIVMMLGTGSASTAAHATIGASQPRRSGVRYLGQPCERSANRTWQHASCPQQRNRSHRPGVRPDSVLWREVLPIPERGLVHLATYRTHFSIRRQNGMTVRTTRVPGREV